MSVVVFIKYFFARKYIKIIFFYFLKIIFYISTSKRHESTKKIILKQRKKINFFKLFLKHKNKLYLSHPENYLLVFL